VPPSGHTDVWTTGTYPPPTYEHIDESSQPINPPPSYNAALLLNYQSKENKLSNPNVMITSNTSDNSNKVVDDGVVMYRASTQNNETSTNVTTISNDGTENNTQINDGEILIVFKQPNQKNDDSIDTTNISNSSSNDKSPQPTQNS
jgi:hypothetical protein